MAEQGQSPQPSAEQTTSQPTGVQPQSGDANDAAQQNDQTGGADQTTAADPRSLTADQLAEMNPEVKRLLDHKESLESDLHKERERKRQKEEEEERRKQQHRQELKQQEQYKDYAGELESKLSEYDQQSKELQQKVEELQPKAERLEQLEKWATQMVESAKESLAAEDRQFLENMPTWPKDDPLQQWQLIQHYQQSRQNGSNEQQSQSQQQPQQAPRIGANRQQPPVNQNGERMSTLRRSAREKFGRR